MKTYPKAYKWMPSNPEKYKGNLNDIWVRSSWERRFLEWCDTNTSVLEYSSEETIIPYVCETDNRLHRYFVDMKLKIKGADGLIKDYVVEIKPHAQTLPPKFPGKQTRRYLEEVETFIKNQSKWKAAKEYAKERNMQFVILTEKELFGTK